MKQKLTLFIALSFVIGLTIYKKSFDNNVKLSNNAVTSTSELHAESDNYTSINTPINTSSEEVATVDEKPAYTEADKVRAQRYIDNNWVADKTINEAVYRDLGGQHTDYWDDRLAFDSLQKLIAETKKAKVSKNQQPNNENDPATVSKNSLVQN